jgi:periplasmic protein TonB
MSGAATHPVPFRMPSDFSRQILSAAIGLAASWLVFYGLSRVQYRATTETTPLIDDLRAVELPMEPPPAPVRPQEVPIITTSNLIILAPEHSESSVKLPAVPVLPENVPPVIGVPRIDFSAKAFKPAEIDSEFETRHVFEPREVDQRCLALVKVRPEVSRMMLREAKRLRVDFICVVNRDGTVQGIRLTDSSGNHDLDSAAAEALKGWRFSPALRHGHAVRQWVQQAFIFKIDAGSPLEAN